MKKVFILTLLITLLFGSFVGSKQKYNSLKIDYQSYIEETELQLEVLRGELGEKADLPTEYLGEFTITHYDACIECCGKTDGITASGAKVCDDVTVAVDPSVIPLGTYIYIEGVGYRVAQDTGGAIKGNRIDVYVHSHSKAQELGRLDNIRVWRIS